MSNSLLTTTQLADKLQVTRQAIYKWRNKGLPVAVNYGNGSGRTLRYDWESVLEWLNQHGKS